MNETAQVTETLDPPKTEEQTVKLWTKRIKEAKVYFEDDFKRMRENMEFAAGLQWQGQTAMNDPEDRYIANTITHHVNQKVASLYARDPKAIGRRRKRLDFQVWDEDPTTLQAAQMAMMLAMQTGPTPMVVQAQALLADVANGKAWQALCDKVGKTLEILYGYQCDTQAPSFKFQMKQLVRRVITCGVGFVRLNFVRQFEHKLSSTLTDDSLAFRLKQAKNILALMQEDKVEEDDPRLEQLQLLFQSALSSVQQGDVQNIEERLEFDFPSATDIIVDPKCKCLKGFIGARWIAQQYILPLDEANAYYELRGEKRIQVGGTFIQYTETGEASIAPKSEVPTVNSPQDLQKEPRGCFWEVYDLTTKTFFTISDGWNSYVAPPKPPDPTINRFWPIFTLTFNDIEVEQGQKVHIYPPSDVQLLKPMQKERNRTGMDLREQRKGNKVFHYTMKGWITEADKEKLSNHETHELIEFEGTPPNGDVTKAIGHWDGVPINPNDFNRAPLDEDTNLAVGSNQVQQGRPIRHVAATPAVIQEQARISDVNSNVDDLDDLLSEMAQASGEMMLREFQEQTVKRIAGIGAVWPTDRREDFLNEIFLDIVASSSGRPNKAVELANFERIAPTLLQSGANPFGVIEEGVKRLDDRLDVSKFLPQPGMQPSASPAQKPSADGSLHRQPGTPGQPLQTMAGQSPMPLPGHNQ